MGPDDTDLLSTGDLARASGLSIKALRLYDETGLLAPAYVDPWSGRRRYHPDQLGRARLVARLRLAGMPLARIRQVADGHGVAAAAEVRSYARQVEADAASSLALLASLAASYDEEGPTMTPTTDRHPVPVTAVRTGQGDCETQEDAVLAGPGVYAVADGVGDVRGAHGLSRRVLDLLAAAGNRLADAADPVSALDAAVTEAASDVAARWGAHPGAGTTLTAVVLTPGRAVLAHLGDSRAHLVRDGRLRLLTRDHTVTQTLVDEGRLTAEEARHDDRRVRLNRAIGSDGEHRPPDLAAHATRTGDRMVLTTDGVHGVLSPAHLTDLLTAEVEPAGVAGAVADAVEVVGAPDNYAVLVLDLT